jgi:GR25 family glycosyltransferase involved in LPS biosynthesis
MKYVNFHQKKIIYIGFRPEHKIESDFIYLNVLKDNQNYQITKSDNITENDFINNDIIICGCFLQNSNHILLMTKYLEKIIFYITEPIEYTNRRMYKLYSKNYINLSIGCVSEKQNNIKHPHYMDVGLTPEKIAQTNDYIKNITYNEVINKKFCCLINGHDMGKTHIGIYDRLKSIGEIGCPNNIYKKITKFQKKYLFTICPENFKTNTSGFVTEKLYLAVVAGTIPIYYGDLDDIDKKIFNMDRIIYFDPSSELSIINAILQIRNLMSDKNKLYEFYKQQPFCDTAISTYNLMIDNLKLRINNFINLEEYNKSLLTDIHIVPPIDHNKKINGIEHIAWINLDRSSDRRNHMENILSNIKIPNKRIQAIDGKAIDLSNFKLLERPMTNYEKACVLSHIKAYSHFVNIPGKYFLVVEDDITFKNLKFIDSDLESIIKNSPDFDILMLSKTCNKQFNSLYTKWDPSIYSAVSYVISKNGLDKLLKKAKFENNNFNFYQPISISDFFLYSGLNTYVYKYNFISTLDETSTIHPEHLPIHRNSSLIQYISLINDTVFNN